MAWSVLANIHLIVETATLVRADRAGPERRSSYRGTFQSVLVLELDQVLVPNDQLAVESFDLQ